MVEPGKKEFLRRAKAALGSSPIYVLRELSVEQVNGTLLLTGWVDSFYHKQMAQEVVRAVADELEVVNTVAVGDSLPADHSLQVD